MNKADMKKWHLDQSRAMPRMVVKKCMKCEVEIAVPYNLVEKVTVCSNPECRGRLVRK
jgi:hypothetical protein